MSDTSGLQHPSGLGAENPALGYTVFLCPRIKDCPIPGTTGEQNICIHLPQTFLIGVPGVGQSYPPEFFLVRDGSVVGVRSSSLGPLVKKGCG